MKRKSDDRPRAQTAVEYRQAEMLGISRGSLYYVPCLVSDL